MKKKSYEQSLNEWITNAPDYAAAFLTNRRDYVCKNTTKIYVNNINTFWAYLSSIGRDRSLASVSTLDADTCRGLISYVANRGLSKASVLSVLSTMNTLYEFMLSHEFIDHNPFTEIKRPRQSRIRHISLSDEQKDAVLHVIKTRENLPKRFLSQELTHGTRARNIAIVRLTMDTGVKSSDLVDLNVCDVDFKRHRICIKDRYFSLSRDTEAVLKECMYMRDVLGISDEEPSLFTASQGKYKNGRISVQTIDTLMRKYIVAAGIPIPDDIGI